jgi:hypothetical protein
MSSRLKPSFMIVEVKSCTHNCESAFLSKLVFFNYEFTVVISVIVVSLLHIIVLLIG